MDIIFQALKAGYRYPSTKGELTTEQLFQLPLTSKQSFDLDTVARTIAADLKAAGEESFVDTASNPARTTLAAKLEVVKAVIADKQADNAAKLAANEIAQRRSVLLDLKAEKQVEALKGLTPEQIDAELAKLG